MALDEFGLTVKQRRFADYYIETGNASEAARRAGYSPHMAHSIGTENTKKPAIKAYIAARTQPADDKRIADADEVLQYLSDVMRGKIRDQFGLDASLQDRTKAAQELMKRYAVADMRQASTMQRLDSLFIEFRAALEEPERGKLPEGKLPEGKPTETPAPEIATETATEPGETPVSTGEYPTTNAPES